MASPFKLFRKRQKEALVVLGLLTMVSFVILPIVLQSMRTGPVANPVVVSTTRYGDIDQAQLHGMIRERQTLQGFMRQVGQAVAQAQDNPYLAQYIAAQLAGYFPPASEESVVDTWVLAHRARQLGLVVSDDAVNQFLRSVTTELGVPALQVQEILAGMKLSQNQLFEMLKHELLARQLTNLFSASLGGTTPAERWDYYQRLNRKVTCEVMPVPVSRFVDEVPEPDEATLKAFFEKYKDAPFVPGSPEPGFLVPKKIAIEYFKADYDKLPEITQVTDAEVKEYYEANKDQLYRREKLPEMPEEKPAAGATTTEPALGPAMEMPPSEEPAEEPTAEEKPTTEEKPAAAETPAGTEKPAEEPAADGKPSEQPAPTEAPAMEDKPSTEDKPADQPAMEGEPAPEEKPADKPAEDEKPTAEEKPADEPVAEEKPADSPAAEDSSLASPASVFHLAAFQSEQEPEAAGPALSGATDAAPPAAEPAKPASEPAAQPAPPAAEPAAEPAPPAAASAAQPVEYAPLEEVTDQIRQRLAEQKIQDVLVALYDVLNNYHDQRIVQENPPERLDFAKLAEENRLSAHKTELMTQYEAEGLDIGTSTVDRTTPFVQSAFGSFEEFKAAQSQDNEGNYYLFWKIDEAEEKTPEFDDAGVHADVLRAWKLIQARDLAKAEAERLAAEAREADKSLTEMFADRPGADVMVTEPFSWLTYGMVPPSQAREAPRISQVESWVTDPATGNLIEREAVEMPGDSFMRVATRLDVGQIGVAVNEPETVACVIRATGLGRPPYQLYDDFLKAHISDYAMVARTDVEAAYKAWQDGIKKSIGLKWERPPEQIDNR